MSNHLNDPGGAPSEHPAATSQLPQLLYLEIGSAVCVGSDQYGRVTEVGRHRLWVRRCGDAFDVEVELHEVEVVDEALAVVADVVVL
ncbi:MAG: hypothetical protein HOW73_39090 [Polyangiaceae bacterium]|nr:hypothetical protein [Polyangiaceae bacterium]